MMKPRGSEQPQKVERESFELRRAHEIQLDGDKEEGALEDKTSSSSTSLVGNEILEGRLFGLRQEPHRPDRLR